MLHVFFQRVHMHNFFFRVHLAEVTFFSAVSFKKNVWPGMTEALVFTLLIQSNTAASDLLHMPGQNC